MTIPAVPRPGTPVLRFLGAVDTVTGSRFLVDTPRARVLVECGLYQGLKKLRLRNWARFPVEPSSIDAVVLTHAHLDHSGYLPALVAKGFEGTIFATPPTRELCGIILPDSGRIQEEDAAYANRKGFSKHRPALPLYTEEDAGRALARFRGVPFGEPVEVAPGVRASFRRAGHILGSASAVLEFTDGSAPPLVVSGDLGRPSHPLLQPPEPPPAAGALLVESTYGDRRHRDREAVQELAGAVGRTAERGGAVVIPAFAVDRTEVILLQLRRLVEEGRIPDLPVYVDSPMALAALGVYRKAVAAGADEIRPEWRGRPAPFDTGGLVEAHDTEASKAIHEAELPAIIVSASGMATGGRVLHHLVRRLPDPRCSVVLVGFQAAGTRGRTLLEGRRTLKLLGRYVPVKAEIVNASGFSVHADREELLGWLGSAPSPPDTVYVVHGEPTAARALRDAIDERLGWTAATPGYEELVRLD